MLSCAGPAACGVKKCAGGAGRLRGRMATCPHCARLHGVSIVNEGLPGTYRSAGNFEPRKELLQGGTQKNTLRRALGRGRVDKNLLVSGKLV